LSLIIDLRSLTIYKEDIKMKEERIKVVIDEEGNASLDVSGVKGKTCLDLTKELEEVLGLVKERKEKKEMHERPVNNITTNVQNIRRG